MKLLRVKNYGKDSIPVQNVTRIFRFHLLWPFHDSVARTKNRGSISSRLKYEVFGRPRETRILDAMKLQLHFRFTDRECVIES